MAKREPSPIRIEGDIAYVTLTLGFVATIDATDVDLIGRYRWRAHASRKGHVYAVRTHGPEDDGVPVMMHRQLLGLRLGSGLIADHIDGDGLNNRRENLRSATFGQNNANRAHGRRNKLGLKGAQYRRGKYHASIKANGKSHHLGSFDTAEEAAAAYYGAARVLWGDFAST